MVKLPHEVKVYFSRMWFFYIYFLCGILLTVLSRSLAFFVVGALFFIAINYNELVIRRKDKD